MFEVTEKAGEMIKEALKDKDPIPSVRVVYSEVADQDPLWAWLWMSREMRTPFLRTRGLPSWSIKTSSNAPNPSSSIL